MDKSMKWITKIEKSRRELLACYRIYEVRERSKKIAHHACTEMSARTMRAWHNRITMCIWHARSNETYARKSTGGHGSDVQLLPTLVEAGYTKRKDKADCSREKSDENAQFRWWFSLVERNEDQCWLYKEEEEELSFPAISLSCRKEGRTWEEVTAGSLRSEKKGGETKLHTRKRDENQEE